MGVDADVIAGNDLGHSADDFLDLVRQRAAIGVTQNDPTCAGVKSGLGAGERVFRIVLVAVEEMLAVNHHLAAGGLGGLDRFLDRGEIFLRLYLECDADMEGRAFADEADRVGFGRECRGKARIVGSRAARALGHAEGGELRLEPARLGKERGVGRIGAVIAALDVIDAEIVEEAHDAELIGEREVDAVHLRAVAQRRVEEIETLFHHATFFTFQLVVPSLRSSSSTPIAASSSRIRSDSLKFFALRATLRASMRFLMPTSSMASDTGRHAAHSAALCCRRPIICALALRHAAAPLAPFAASLRNSCKAAKAFGVFKSSASASTVSAHSIPGLASAVSDCQ